MRERPRTMLGGLAVGLAVGVNADIAKARREAPLQWAPHRERDIRHLS
jgi:hypothetical protein